MTNDLADLRDIMHEHSSLHFATEQSSVTVEAIGQRDAVNHLGVKVNLESSVCAIYLVQASLMVST
jgi:hypothetical protein